MMANYQTVGYNEDGLLVELRPQRRVRVVDVATGKEAAPSDPHAPLHQRGHRLLPGRERRIPARSFAPAAPARARDRGAVK